MKRYMFAWIVVAVLAAGTSAQAQTLNGVELSQEVGNDLKKVFADPNFWAEAVIREAWLKMTPKLNAAINKALPSVDPQLPKGIGVYNVDCRLNSDCRASAHLGAKGIQITMTAKNNSLFFKTTTPDIAFGIGLGSYADPKFSLSFDITCTAQIALSGPVKSLTLGPASLTVSHVRWDSQNFSGDLVKAADSIYKFFTHRDFMAKLLKNRTINLPALQVKLDRLNRELGKLRRQGFALIHSYEAKGRKLKLTALPPNLQGIELDQGDGKGHKKVFADPSFGSGAAFHDAWVKNLPDVNKAILAATAGNTHFTKITHPENHLGKDCQTFIHLVGNSIRIRMVTRYHRFSYRLPNGHESSISYDLVVETSIALPAKGQGLKLSPTILLMSNVCPNDLSAESNALSHYFESADFRAKVMQHNKITLAALQKKLDKLNAEIAKLSPHGSDAMTQRTDASGNLKLTVAKTSSAPSRK